MANSRDDEAPEVKADTPDTSERQKDFTRRALLRAGWVVPAVTAINIPSASAQTPTPHNDVHGDMAHVDEVEIHSDLHIDTPPPGHQDLVPPHVDVPHSDTPTPHTDTPHVDDPVVHTDHTDGGVHGDAHGDAHQDHDDHTDAHGDFSFKDHTDGGHTDHLDTSYHTDHTDTAAIRITWTRGTGIIRTGRSATRIHRRTLIIRTPATRITPTPTSLIEITKTFPTRITTTPTTGTIKMGPTVITITPTATIRIISTPAIGITPMPAIRTRLVRTPIETIPTSSTTTTSTPVHHRLALRRHSAAHRCPYGRTHRRRQVWRPHGPRLAYRHPAQRRRSRRLPRRLGQGGHGGACRYPRRFNRMSTGSRDDQLPEVKTETAETSERQKDFTRRALLRAGWVVPAVTAINIPSASAQTPTPHNDTHGDAGHGDNIIEHLDVHLDSPVPPHDDHTDHVDSPHADTPHTDVPHSDAPHTDAPHSDTPPHTDLPHSDTPPHTDAPHTDHTDGPHTDAPHTDTPAHTDAPHTDTPPHTDVPHTDTPPHTDVPHSDTPAHTDVPHTDTPSHGDHADAATHVDCIATITATMAITATCMAMSDVQRPHRPRACRSRRYRVPYRSPRHRSPPRSYDDQSGPGHLDSPSSAPAALGPLGRAASGSRRQQPSANPPGHHDHWDVPYIGSSGYRPSRSHRYGVPGPH